MIDREETWYRFAQALEHSREAWENQQAADQAHDTPENAAKLHWDAAGLLEGVLTRVKTMHAEHVFAAKRMQLEARREHRTGREYRRGGNEAA